MKNDPIKKFKTWWDKANVDSPLNQKNSVCLSTINKDGFPSGRFVDLKDVKDRCFIFCTSFDSKKAREISKNPKVALTIWWDHVGFQVRIMGNASIVPDSDAAAHWENRSREAQITSIGSNQSERISSLEKLKDNIESVKNKSINELILPKPANWGCFKIQPIRIEFLTFNKNRLHIRELFEVKEGKWEKSLLQP